MSSPWSPGGATLESIAGIKRGPAASAMAELGLRVGTSYDLRILLRPPGMTQTELAEKLETSDTVSPSSRRRSLRDPAQFTVNSLTIPKPAVDSEIQA